MTLLSLALQIVYLPRMEVSAASLWGAIVPGLCSLPVSVSHLANSCDSSEFCVIIVATVVCGQRFRFWSTDSEHSLGWGTGGLWPHWSTSEASPLGWAAGVSVASCSTGPPGSPRSVAGP